jgi:pyruvate-formate lyase-activating enzyme
VRSWRKTLGDVAVVARGLIDGGWCPPLFEGATPTARRLTNWARLSWEWYRLIPSPRSYPARLCIESSGACNLSCPHCFTGAGETGRQRATLSLEFYRRLLAELGDHLWQVEFHNWGEPLLNKNLFVMVAEASARGLSTSVCTNFSLPFDEARATALVRSGLKLFGVSIDGARQETYEQYRVGGRLDVVLRNCRLVNDAKQRLGSRTPRVNWVFHMFSHNVGEVDEARAMAAELGMDFGAARGRVVGPDWDPEARWIPHERIVPTPCYTLFHTAVVYADGSVAPCRGSFYPEDDMGRLAADGRPGATTFRELWNGERFRMARRFFTTRKGTSDDTDHICLHCPAVLDWEDWTGHVALGGSQDSWHPRYTGNDRYNYFWSRRRRPRVPTA